MDTNADSSVAVYSSICNMYQMILGTLPVGDPDRPSIAAELRRSRSLLARYLRAYPGDVEYIDSVSINGHTYYATPF